MVVVAVAGGSGGVGKTIVNQLELSKGHTIFVLSRTALENQAPSTARFIKVDYNDTASLSRCLEENEVEAVISTINLQDEAASNAQLSLIEAAGASKTTKRFIPSEFAFVNSPDGAEDEPSVRFAIKSVDALRSSSLEFTRFANGFFMDYWGLPHISSNLWAYTWAIDIANKRAAIPGTGDDVLSLTYSVDVARFVVRTLESSDKWPETSILSGTDITFNQLLAIAERIRGCKFDTTYDSLEALERNEATLLQVGYGGGGGASEDEAKQMVSLFGRMTISGSFRLPDENRINDKFPGLRPMTAEELLTMAWAEK
ncbi:NmrA domain-containing protein [Fusarium keratoplasticum]|nr:NmrA domain-containing protein [Fusarium keratoplasticum]